MRDRYWIMDGRAEHDFDAAFVHYIADTLKEARETAPDYGDDCWIFDTKTEDLIYAGDPQ